MALLHLEAGCGHIGPRVQSIAGVAPLRAEVLGEPHLCDLDQEVSVRMNETLRGEVGGLGIPETEGVEHARCRV